MAPPAEVRYRNRETGAIETERVFGANTLRFLYEGRLGRALTDLLLSREAVNRVYGRLQRTARSRGKIREFVRSLGIDASEAERPLQEYRSLDDFFTRRLKSGTRPIDPDPAHLCSPADARLLCLPRLETAELAVKGSRVPLALLLGDPALARRYEGGVAFVARLAPADYHRFHFPDAGVASPARPLGRGLHSVHPIALAASAPSFRNKRQVSTLASGGFGDLCLVEVGALCVGTIEQTYVPGPVGRGQEKGLFRFGGSTVVLLAEAERLRPDDDLVASSAEGLETLVKVGTRIARRA